MDRPYVLPCPAKAFALGLDDVNVWLSSLVDSGPWDIFICTRGPEQHFLTGTLLLDLFGTFGSVKVGLLHVLPQ